MVSRKGQELCHGILSDWAEAADQEEGHKAALKVVQDREAALQAEYETEAAG